ncbi:MAG: endolytic transglycosylase MltG [Christensenella sp.]
MATKLENPYEDKNDGFDSELLSNGMHPKKKPRKTSVWSKLRPIVAFVISIAIVACVVFGAFNYIKKNYFDPVDSTDSSVIEVEIPKGSSLDKISKILYENDLIRNKQIFKLYTDFSDMSGKLKAGTYSLSKSMTFDDLIYSLQEGNVAAEVIDVQFIEGQAADDYAQKLVNNYGILKDTAHYTEVVTTGGKLATQYPFLVEIKTAEDAKPADAKRKYLLEGYLFPDKYQYFTNATVEDIIKKQLDQFQKIFDNEEYQVRAAELGMSVDQVVTLASIIEKEAKSKQFKQVSAVFHNRLNADMTLGSDATIAYALGVKRINLTTPELETASPYNTHLNKGLPAGPICNPGKAAIEAALYPDEELMREGDEYYFFTLTDPEEMELAFTRTNDEHEAIKAQWKDAWDKADAEAAAKAAAQ